MIYASVATSETGLASLRRTYARASRFLQRPSTFSKNCLFQRSPSSRGDMGGGFKLALGCDLILAGAIMTGRPDGQSNADD